MPEKYVIHAKATPPRFRPIGKLGIVDWREDCSSCHNCVKYKCVFDLYKDEAQMLHDETGYLDYLYQCKGCLACVQNCTKNILTRLNNPEYDLLGDEYYNPDIISSTWYQAETGKIPVTGSGYSGKFTGKGFDSMWTDMSEIVRPTRDGIHGREYINTTVEIGRKLPFLSFKNKDLAVSPPHRLTNPVPLVFDLIPQNFKRGAVIPAIIEAGVEMGSLSILEFKDISEKLFKYIDKIIPYMDDLSSGNIKKVKDAPMLLIPDKSDVLSSIKTIKKNNGKQIVAIRIQATPKAKERIQELVDNGVEVIQIEFNRHGMEDADKPRHMRDYLLDIHRSLVKAGNRDQVTIMTSGGIALAEHMTKAIICGADLVGIDLPLIIAMECRLCLECERGELCQVRLEDIEMEYGKIRVINLIHAWRNQLLELLGAMGIREARRLKGETGRCMFFEDLEEETFGKLFGKRKEQNGGQST